MHNFNTKDKKQFWKKIKEIEIRMEIDDNMV